MESRYYHGLAGGIPYWKEQAVLEESLKALDLIFKFKGLYCSRILNEFGIKISKEKASVYNGENYISICIDNPTDDEFTFENTDLDPSFYRYAKTKIAIELKPTIVETCTFREEPYKRLPGERQIYNSIDISNFYRILVGLKYFSNEAIDEISKICSLYNIPIPVMTFKEAEILDESQNMLQMKL